MVICRYYKRTKKEVGGKDQNWRFTLRFHPQCWIDQGVAALKQRGEVVETRGRNRLVLTDNDSLTRLKILRRRAAVMQRLRIEVAKPDGERNIDRVIHFGSMLNKLKEEIESLGGVPKSW